MDFRDCLRFANDNKIGYIATVEGDQPRVRAVTLLFADNTGFYFQTGAYKSFYKQLQNSRKVEIIFPNKPATEDVEGDPKSGLLKAMRVAGEVEFVDNIQLKVEIMEERNELVKQVGFTGPEDPRFIIFRISKGEAYFFERKDAGKESEVEKIKF